MPEERERLGDALVYSLALLVVGLVWFRAGTAVHISSIPRAASAFALPMLLDRRVDGVTAVVTSINAVLRNKPAMLVWSLLIEAAIAIGFATALVGLIVTMPVIGHAGWHAYRETIDSAAWPAA